MVSIKPSVPFIWVPDENVEKCAGCKNDFSMFNRKHHCRFCGKIYCSTCLPFMQQLSWNESEQKCCIECNKTVHTIKTQKTKNIVLANLPLCIHELTVFLYINKSWNKSVTYIISIFKGISFKMTYSRWNKIERMLIKTHFNEIKIHSRYFIQSLKALYGFCNTTELNKMMKSKAFECSCDQMFCHNKCKRFSIYDMIDLLYNKPLLLEYESILKWCISMFKSFHTDEISLFLPWILDIGINKGSQLFIKSLISRCDQMNFAYKFYFECKLFFHTSNKAFYVSLVQNMILKCPFTEDILKTERFVQSIQSGVYEMKEENIRMPYDPSIIIEKILKQKIKKINSFTQPVKIPMQTNDGVKNILIKKEDVRPDRLAVLMMFLMNQFDDFNFKPYSVFAVDDREGWIEMIDNVETLYEIQKTTTIQNYILSKNQDKNIKQLRRTFIKSCASNCILTYILGVGDRNLCNILVHDDGSMIHIDYSYILGHDPKWQKVEMRITPGMVEMIGGKNAIEYEQLKVLCTTMYKQIRKHAYFWSVFIHYLGKTNPPIEKYYGKKTHIKTHIEQRLMLNSSSDEINMFIIETVNKNSGSTIMSYLSDSLFHARSTLDEYMFHLEV